MIHITILDFTTSTTYVRKVPAHMIHDEAEDIMEYYAELLGLHSEDCQYMVGRTTFDIEDTYECDTCGDTKEVTLGAPESGADVPVGTHGDGSKTPCPDCQSDK